MLSVRPSNARECLLEDPCSLYVQSNINSKRLQSDGWGIGFYAGGASHLVKSKNPVYEEYESFVSAVKRANSKIILTHIRRASNPRGLPREMILSIENSQPFKYKNYLFAHNGTITIPDEVTGSLGEWKEKIKGFNDSEVYFWYIMKEVTNGASFSDALKKFERTISELWQKNYKKYPSRNRPYVGLNALLSDGERLYAYCKYSEDDETTKSLCLGEQPVFQMSYLINPERLVVASEKTNRQDNWKPLKSGQLLVGRIKGNKVSIELQDVK